MNRLRPLFPAALACACALLASAVRADAASSASDRRVAVAAPDTTLAVGRGDTLVLRDLGGELVLQAWTRDEVRVAHLDDPTEPVDMRRTGGGVVLRGGRRNVELRVQVPSWLPVEVRGRDLAVEARGLSAFLRLRTLEGDVVLDDLSGRVHVHTLDGEIRAEDVAGEVELRSVDDDVTVRGAAGRLRVVSTDGDLTLEDVDVDVLDATTTDGDIRFRGAFRPGGSYALVTHSGDVFAEIPAGSDLAVVVSTFDGELDASFPITLDGILSGRETRFTLGRGGAQLSLEAFDGDIVLRRPGGR